MALVLSLVQDENLHSLSKFLKHVIIKTFLDYKESAMQAPQGTYTGNIVAEPYFDDIFKLLTEKTPENEEEEEEKETMKMMKVKQRITQQINLVEVRYHINQLKIRWLNLVLNQYLPPRIKTYFRR